MCQPGNPASCNFNGDCNVQGTACECSSDWYHGPKCTVTSNECPGYGEQPAPVYFSADVCNKRGKCVEAGKCECDSGFYGQACENAL